MMAQLGTLTSRLKQMGVASFEGYQGTIQTDAGLGIGGLFDGPYYQYFPWPPQASEEDELSIREACEDLETYLEENGPFDALLGFSQGSTLLVEFLCHFARQNPGISPPTECAILLNAIPPHRMGGDGKPIIDYQLLRHFPKIPTLHVMGTKDFVYEYSMILQSSISASSSTLVVHDKGHEIPHESKTAQKICSAFEQLCLQVALGA